MRRGAVLPDYHRSTGYNKCLENKEKNQGVVVAEPKG
jgi:hypothetical protein